MTTTDTPKTTYRLGSSPMVYTPNIIAFALSMPKAKGVQLLMDGYDLPRSAALYLYEDGAYTIEGETVVFTA